MDHIIVGRHEAHMFARAEVMLATIEEIDHHIVHTTMSTTVGDDGLGKQRPIGPCIKDWDEEQWEKVRNKIGGWAWDGEREKNVGWEEEGEAELCVQKIEAIQIMLMETAKGIEARKRVTDKIKARAGNEEKN
jgi:hypothetical protein